MKPKHKPPKTQQLEHDPKLVLLALNLLIESHKANSLPPELLSWVKTEIVDKGLAYMKQPIANKRAA